MKYQLRTLHCHGKTWIREEIIWFSNKKLAFAKAKYFSKLLPKKEYWITAFERGNLNFYKIQNGKVTVC